MKYSGNYPKMARNLTFVCIFVFLEVVTVAAVCDEQSTSRVMQCLFKSNALSQGLTTKAQSEGVCKNPNVTSECMMKEMMECEGNEKQMKMMKLMVSPSKMQASIQYMCENLNVFETKKLCAAKWIEPQSNLSKCMQDAVGVVTNAASGTDAKQLLEGLCNFLKQFINCFVAPMIGDCKDLGTFISKSLSGYTPPYCELSDEQKEIKLNEIKYGTTYSTAPRKMLTTFLLLPAMAMLLVY